MSHDGWITVGTAQSQYWWRWEDAADSPPRMADLSVASTPGVFIDRKYCALGAVYGIHELARSAPVPLVFAPRLYDRNSARRPDDAQPVPVREPVGLAVLPGPHPALIVSDASTRQLWTTRLDVQAFLPVAESWQPMPLSGAVLTRPTDVAALEDNSLLVADAGRVWHVRRDGDAWHACGHYDGPPDEQLGSQLHLAVDGPWVLVSDCERHRVLWLEQTSWTLLGQWGTSDRPGPGLNELRHPTFVTIAGRRAVVADAGNQRLVLLELEEELGSQNMLGGSVRLGHTMHDPIRQQHLRDRQ